MATSGDKGLDRVLTSALYQGRSEWNHLGFNTTDRRPARQAIGEIVDFGWLERVEESPAVWVPGPRFTGENPSQEVELRAASHHSRQWNAVLEILLSQYKLNERELPIQGYGSRRTDSIEAMRSFGWVSVRNWSVYRGRKLQDLCVVLGRTDWGKPSPVQDNDDWDSQECRRFVDEVFPQVASNGSITLSDVEDDDAYRKLTALERLEWIARVPSIEPTWVMHRTSRGLLELCDIVTSGLDPEGFLATNSLRPDITMRNSDWPLTHPDPPRTT